MLDNIVENLKIDLDNKANDLAILNTLQAKLNYIFGFKKVKFISIANVSIAYPLAYYAFNFVESGGVKNQLINSIDYNLFSFFDDYLKKYNQNRFDNLQDEHIKELEEITDKNELNRRKIEQRQEIKKLSKLTKETSNATPAKVYDILQIVDKEKEGAFLTINTEFGNYYEDAIVGKDKIKKEFLDSLYDLYDGRFNATNTIGTERDNISDVSASAIFMTDPELLTTDPRLRSAFKSYLARGMARRSFIFFNKGGNYYNLKYLPSMDEKTKAINNLKKYATIIKRIFDSVDVGKTYYFNQEANEYINKYRLDLSKTIIKFYKYTEVLDSNTKIIKLDLEHSTWKIIKLAVLYHILNDPISSFVTVQDFKQAQMFFEKTHQCLIDMLNDKDVSNYDKLFNLLIKNINKFVSRADIVAENIVPERELDKWLKTSLVEIKNKVKEHGLGFATKLIDDKREIFDYILYEDKYEFVPDNKGGGKLIAIDLTDRVINEIGGRECL